MADKSFDRKTLCFYDEETAAKGGAFFLYKNFIGRMLLENVVVKKFCSDLAGAYCASWISKLQIKQFIKKHNIDMSRFQRKNYRCFNDFFIRHLKKSAFKIDTNMCHLIAPCDSKLSIYRISDDLKVRIKGCDYTVFSLLKNNQLAQEYKNGVCAVFRLTVDDYHRYVFFDSGCVGDCCRIPGVYHTVGNISNGKYSVYSENTREYTELFTDNFQKVIFMEVGALFVGRIMNRPGISQYSKGDEKGYFSFGGSTVVLLFKENTVCFDSDIEKLSSEGTEVKVAVGEKIGRSVLKPISNKL